MRKMPVLIFLLLSNWFFAFTLQSFGDNPALLAYDRRSVISTGVDLDGALLQNFFSVQDWNNYLDGLPILIDDMKLEVLKGEDLVLAPKVSATGFFNLSLLGLRITLNGGIRGAVKMNLPYEMMETLLKGVDIGYYNFEGSIQGIVWDEAGFGMSGKSGKISWGVNLAMYAILADLRNSDLKISYNSQFEPTTIKATTTVHTEIYSSYDLKQMMDSGDFDLFETENTGFKMDLGFVYGEEYPVFGIALKNLTLVPAKVEYVLQQDESTGFEVDLSDLANTEPSSTQVSTESFERIDPEDLSLPMAVEAFFFKRLGILSFGFRGSYDTRDVWNIGMSTGLSFDILPMSFEYTYHSNGCYEKTFTIGLDLHLLACIVKLSWISKEPWDTDPVVTPFAPRLDVIAIMGI